MVRKVLIKIATLGLNFFLMAGMSFGGVTPSPAAYVGLVNQSLASFNHNGNASDFYALMALVDLEASPELQSFIENNSADFAPTIEESKDNVYLLHLKDELGFVHSTVSFDFSLVDSESLLLVNRRSIDLKKLQSFDDFVNKILARADLLTQAPQQSEVWQILFPSAWAGEAGGKDPQRKRMLWPLLMGAMGIFVTVLAAKKDAKISKGIGIGAIVFATIMGLKVRKYNKGLAEQSENSAAPSPAAPTSH